MHSKFKKNLGWAAKITVKVKKKNNIKMREKDWKPKGRVNVIKF